MIRLAAFADEISPDLDEQIEVLKAERIAHVELRSVWGINVLSLDLEQAATTKRRLEDSGIAVAAIGSSIGKVPLDRAEAETEHMERAIELAHHFEAPMIRMFSFYGTSSGDDPINRREATLDRMRGLADRAAGAGVLLVHENEKDIFGDSISRCVDLMEAVDSPSLRSAFDPANFIQVDQRPYPDAYEALRPWIAHVHVKDALLDGTVVPAGDGATGWQELLESLRRDGYDGFLSIEPHLASEGRFGGFSGPDGFRRASESLKRLLRDMGWEYR
jgi:sugar phosphate isomerase/epimerase